MTDSGSPSAEYVGRETLSDLRHARNYNAHLRALIQENYNEDSSVLDFGAGNGHFLNLIKDKGREFYAVEPDAALRELIRKSTPAKVLPPGDIEVGSIDFLYTLNVLEHIENDEPTFELFFDWIRPGGTLLVYVPAFPHLYSKFDSAIGHFRRYTKSELVEKVEKAGFRVSEVEYVDPVGYAFAFIYRLFFNSGSVSPNQLLVFDKFFYPVSKKVSKLTRKLFGKNLLLIAKKV